MLFSEFDDILLDYARQQATPETIQKLFELAEVGSFSFVPEFFHQSVKDKKDFGNSDYCFWC